MDNWDQWSELTDEEREAHLDGMRWEACMAALMAKGLPEEVCEKILLSEWID